MSSNIPSSENALRERRISAVVLIFACVLVALGCFDAAYRLWLPTEGWGYTSPEDFDDNRLFFTRNLLGEPTPLQENDQLVAVNGVPNANYQPIADAFRAGDVARYTVMRDGQMLELAVPLKHWTPAAVLAYKFSDLGGVISYCAGWFLFGLGVFVLVRRPQENAARGLLLFAAASLTPSIALVPDGVTTQYSWIYLLTGAITYWIWAVVLAPSLFVLALTFPQPKRFIRRRPWLLLLPYAVFWLLTAIFGLKAQIGYGLSGAFFVLSLLSIIHTIFTERDAVSRAQLMWGFGGFLALLICYVPFFIQVGFALAGVQGSGFILQTDQYTGFVNVVASFGFPLFQVMIAIAILRYRLFDIDIIIRRTLVYSVLTVLLGATYFIGVVALQGLFVRLTGQENALAVVASTLAIAALFVPLRRRVQAVIDRRFFRRKYDARQVLEQFALRAQQQADLGALANDIVAVVDETVQPEHVRLWLVRR